MKKKLIIIIMESLKEVNATLEDPEPELEKPTVDTQIFGDQGHLDSLGLVALISIIESKISDEFNKEIVIVTEKTMSRKSSPFRSVQSLVDFIGELLKEE